MSANDNSLMPNKHRRQIFLSDVNIPYKFSLERSKNELFFCINADEYSDQSFQSAVLDINSGKVRIIPNIRNGFATAVDQDTGTVYLGGSEGIYKYNHQTQEVDRPAIVKGVDIFDMYFKNYLYFVDTTNLDLFVLKNGKKFIISNVEEYGIHHFIIDNDENIIFANPGGLFYLHKNAKSAVRFFDSVQNIRGITTNIEGKPYLIAKNGIYSIDQENNQIFKLFTLNDGNGLAFDNDNNIVYSDQRTVVKLIPYK